MSTLLKLVENSNVIEWRWGEKRFPARFQYLRNYHSYITTTFEIRLK